MRLPHNAQADIAAAYNQDAFAPELARQASWQIFFRSIH
jgi:hypothetical protein